MKRFISKKVVALLVAAGAVVVLAVGAYAYWSAGGSGAGSATAGTSTNNLTIAGNPAAGIYPGGTAAVHVVVTNPNAFSVYVNNVHADISASGSCNAADFHFADKALNTRILAGQSASYDQDLSMDDTAVSQDACKSATITLTYSSN